MTAVHVQCQTLVATRALLTDTCEQPSLRKAPFLNDNLTKQCPFMLHSRHLPGSMDVPCRNGRSRRHVKALKQISARRAPGLRVSGVVVATVL
eukprot:scaffold6142_cov41-Phaeocystis_antarctica.AAC.1